MRVLQSYKLYILLTVGLCFQSNLFAQHGHGHGHNPAPDMSQIKAVFNNPKLADTLRAERFSSFLISNYIDISPDSMYLYGSELASFARVKSIRKYEGHGIMYMAYSLQNKGEALLGLNLMQKARLIAIDVDDKVSLARLNLNIGGMKYELKEYSEAITLLENSMSLYELFIDSSRLARALVPLASSYSFLGNKEKAIQLMERCILIYTSLNDPSNLAQAYHNLGSIYGSQKETKKAVDLHIRGLNILKEHPDVVAESHLLLGMGDVYLQAEDWPKAVKWCKRGLKLADEVINPYYQLASCECLFEAYKKLGDAAKAMEMNDRVDTLKKVLQKDEKRKKLQQLEFEKLRYEDSVVQAEREKSMSSAHANEVGKKNRTRNILISIGLILLMAAAGLYERNRRSRRARILAESERERSDNLLFNILPEDIANELKEKGEATARNFEMVSIIFTDFKEFTQLSSSLSASELVSEINHCFRAFDTICEKRGVEKIKTIGDAYMAAGGLPIPSNDSTKNTVLAAMEMSDFIETRRRELETQGKQGFRMRAGVHTGPVVAGIIGVKKFQYDVWGDTVNTASRMESSGEPGKVNISEATYELIRHLPEFNFESRGKIEAKGKGAVDMFFVNRMLTP